jgi:hypothetical protein
MSNFRPIDRETGFLFPPSIDDWLPEKHLARFVVEVINGLDLSGMTRRYRGSGSRQPHYPPLHERFTPPPPTPENPTPTEAMDHRLKTPVGKALYALRKQTVEPVFGIIKSVMGFRQFMLRGLDKVRAEWSLVTMAWNIKRMFILSQG